MRTEKEKHRQKCGVSTLIYRNRLLSTAQHNRKRREKTSLSFKINAKTYSVCILLYIFTHAQTNRGGGRAGWGQRLGPCHGLWAITGDTIWVTYSGEKASKPTEGIKSLPPRMLSFQIRQLFFSSFQQEEVADKQGCLMHTVLEFLW